jgi:hypothetical protein
MPPKVENKRYYSRVPGSAFIFADGTRVIFAHGFLDVSPNIFPGEFRNMSFKDHPDNGRPRYEAYCEELDRLVGEGNPLIFTQETVQKLQELPKPTQNAQAEAEIARQDQALRSIARVGGGAVETGELNKPGVVNPNESTVDTDLQKRMFAARPPVVGPGAKTVEQIKQEAAQRTGIVPPIKKP